MSKQQDENSLFELGSQMTRHFQEAAQWISEKLYEQNDPGRVFEKIKTCNPFVLPGLMTDFFWNQTGNGENKESE
jgi:hypothetical protein